MKGGIGGETHVLDGRQWWLSANKQHLCAVQRGIAGGVDERVRRFQKANAQGTLDLHIVAKAPGEPKLATSKIRENRSALMPALWNVETLPARGVK